MSDEITNELVFEQTEEPHTCPQCNHPVAPNRFRDEWPCTWHGKWLVRMVGRQLYWRWQPADSFTSNIGKALGRY